jgi:hypothetical protein
MPSCSRQPETRMVAMDHCGNLSLTGGSDMNGQPSRKLELFFWLILGAHSAIPGMTWQPPSTSPQREENQPTFPPFGGD